MKGQSSHSNAVSSQKYKSISLRSRLTLITFLKFCLLILLIHLIPSSIEAQSSDLLCKTYNKGHNIPIWHIPSTDSSNTFYDRFGNIYSHDELSFMYHSNASLAECTNTGYFLLIYEGAFSLEEKTTICAVFNYLSTLITPQISNPLVNIHLVKESFINPNTGSVDLSQGATGSPYWSTLECGIANSLVQQAMLGSSVNSDLDHGLIRINSNIIWHNYDPLNPTAPVPNDKYDLYSVVLHEALHVLGFASNITVDSNGNGIPWFGNIFSTWDTYLYSQIEQQFLLKTLNNGICCDEHEFNNEEIDMPSAVNQGCASKIYFRVGGGTGGNNLAVVNYDNGISNVPNILSHLPDACNNGEFVMNPGVGLGVKKRLLNVAEIDILCSLGYIAGGCNIQVCNVSANNDGPFIWEQGTIETLTSTMLTSNDAVPANSTFKLNIDCNNLPLGATQVNSNGDEITINTTNLPFGVYRFCYTITGCDGKCDDGIVTIVVSNPLINSCCEVPNTDCNETCLGDFELFSSSEELSQILTNGPFGEGFWFTPINSDNTPDLINTAPSNVSTCSASFIPFPSPPGNSIVLYVNDPFIHEGISLPLCTPVPIGSSVTVYFKAATTNACLPASPMATIEFSEFPPVSQQSIYINPGVNSSQYTVPVTTSEQTIPVFGSYSSPAIVNNSNVPWNYLIFSLTANTLPSGYATPLCVDDIVVVIDKKIEDILNASPTITSTTPCINGLVNIDYEICNTTNEISPDIDLSLSLPTGLTFIPTSTFQTQNISLPSGWLLPNECKHLFISAQVDNDISLVGQNLPIALTIDGLPSNCWEDLSIESMITPINQSLDIQKSFIEDASTGEIEFSVVVTNSHSSDIQGVEVKDVVSTALNITDPADFTQNGNTLSKIVTVPANGQIELSFTAQRNCACNNIENCATAHILNGGCGDVIDCIVVPGFSDQPNSSFTSTPDPLNCLAFVFESATDFSCDNHSWNFGDGSSSAEGNTSHLYTNSGTYTVTHTVTNSCGISTSTSTINVDCGDFICPCVGTTSLNIDAGSATPGPSWTNSLSVLSTQIPSLTVNSIFSPNTLNNTCLAISGTLVIDNNYNLAIINGEIRMQPGARIVVKSGSTLTLAGINAGTGTQKGIHGCEKMWRSIQVEEGGSLYAAYNVIQDAEIAFDIKSNKTSNTTLTTAFNDFDRNHISVRIANTELAAINQPFSFGENKFRATTALLPKFSNDITNWNSQFPFSGMVLDKTIITLGQNSNPSYKNEFYGLRNGIIATNSSISAYSLNMHDLEGPGSITSYFDFLGSGIGLSARACNTLNIKNSIFNQIATGILADKSSIDFQKNVINNVDDGVIISRPDFQKVKIDNNDIYFRDYGIYSKVAGGALKVNIDNNIPIESITTNEGNAKAAILMEGAMPYKKQAEASITNNQIKLNGGGVVLKGIETSLSGNWNIRENRIEYVGANTPSDFIPGIHMYMSDDSYLYNNEVIGNSTNSKIEGIAIRSTKRCTLCCNVTNNFYTGITFNGVCADTKLRHSEIGNHAIGMEIKYGYIDDQIRASNKWNSSNYSESSASHGGILTDIQNSEFLVKLPVASPYWPNDPSSPAWPDQWFLPDLTNNSVLDCSTDGANCPTALLPPPGAGVIPVRDFTDSEIMTAENNFESTSYGEMVQFESGRKLYKMLKENNSFLNLDSNIDAFYGDNENGTLNLLYEIDKQISEMWELDSIDKFHIINYSSIIESTFSSIGAIDSLYADALSLTDSLSLQNQKQILIKSLEHPVNNLHNLIDSLYYSRIGKVSDILSLNNTIEEVSTLVSNRKFFTQIFLETIASDVLELTGLQKDLLLSIAMQCPNEGGDAVLQARSLYNLLDTYTVFNDEELCSNSLGRNNLKHNKDFRKSEYSKIDIAPNPSRGQFRIKINNTNIDRDEKIEVNISDISGKSVASFMTSNNEIISLPFPPGLYFCQININNEVSKTMKLVIVK